MMNQSTTGGLGYDPCDRHSFPYQANDPPFDATSLALEPSTLRVAAELDIMETISEVIGYPGQRPEPHFRMLDMALRTFYKIANDSAYEGIDFPSLFAACCDTAMIWENG
jgi:hypothetical protein